MAREETHYVCTNCGYESPKWLGRCPVCGEWNTMKEVKVTSLKGKPTAREKMRPISLDEIEEGTSLRIKTSIGEFNRVIGGGIPKSAMIILGGEPGVGKSTLILRIALELSNNKTLYVTGEESLSQIKERSERLGFGKERLFVLSENDLNHIIEVSEEIKPDFLIIDSIQTIQVPELPSAQGSVVQVRECGSRLLRLSKEKGITVILIGHVTKDGTLAGPRTLEHMVDIVLSLEGERTSGLRILRALKNRYGSTEEMGIFEMTPRGLVEVKNPSSFFLSQDKGQREGVAVVPLLEGKRPILVELQSLVTPSPFSLPQRSSTGYDLRRLNMLLALLEKRLGIPMGKSDVFVNVTGGIRVQEAAADLGMALSILSSRKKRILPYETIFVGEMGLSGEVRPVKGLRVRLEEAKRVGFKRAFIPPKHGLTGIEGLEITVVSNLGEAFRRCLQ